ncbi:MAG: hypothetical protein Q7R87_00755 [Nanoarchaeota archaeon]|nr:hypothetical protein [Nanoarchaeota archaeon]
MKIHSKNLLDYIKKGRVVTSSEIANIYDVNWNTAERYLLELMAESKIIRIKKQGVNLWLIK